MMLFRPVTPQDLPFLIELAGKAGTGLTTLPKDKQKLEQKIQDSLRAFSQNTTQPGNENYLFVLEDLDSNKVIGTSGLAAAVGLEQAFYSYKVSTTMHTSPKLSIATNVDTLYLGNDYTGCTEICTLFLDPEERKNNNGKLLSKSRFLFMASFPERFAKTIIAEMRGYSDEKGISPFWESLGRKFFNMDFAEADRLSGLGNNQFIAELMPKHPIYVALLSAEAQAVIGQVHKETRPALQMLLREGFHYRNYVDIFDAGPTIEADFENLHSIANSHLLPTFISEADCQQNAIVANCALDFRASIAKVDLKPDSVGISAELAQLLKIEATEPLRVYPL